MFRNLSPSVSFSHVPAVLVTQHHIKTWRHVTPVQRNVSPGPPALLCSLSVAVPHTYYLSISDGLLSGKRKRERAKAVNDQLRLCFDDKRAER